MKKLEIIIRPERLDDLKTILNSCNAHGLMIETIVDDDTAEKIIDLVIEEINTGLYGDGKIFVYDVCDAVRIRTGERGVDAL